MRVEDQTLPQSVLDKSAIRLLLISLRPWEWVKNVFLFSALFFSANILNPEMLLKSLFAFGLFCLAAGGVYLVNDIWDRRQDAMHPQKRLRPIASGALPVGLAAPVAVVGYVFAVGGAFLLNPMFGAVTAAYVILSVVYSKWLKHAVILDVFSIAAGFVLRVVAGAMVIDITMNH
jgi:4-hydroxybenzoate polyprenyltransferase